MNSSRLPLLLVFLIASALIIVAVEVGFRMGRAAHRHSVDEKESPVSAITGTVLGILAFILAFTFAIVSDRYDARKELVRQDADNIRTAYVETDFMPEPDSTASKELLNQYLAERIAMVQGDDVAGLKDAFVRAEDIQHKLWSIAIAYKATDLNNDIGSAYYQSLTNLFSTHARRVSIGFETRLPNGVWMILLALLFIGMLAVGYQTAISESQRTWAALILAFAFALVITLIAALDRPYSTLLPVSQQPLIDVQEWVTGHGTP